MEIAPTAVWDCRDPDWPRDWQAKSDWLREHGLSGNKAYRIEFYLIDGPVARIFCYAIDGDGKVHWTHGHDPDRPHDHGTCDVAREDPCDVLLDELPPPELR